MKVLIIVAIIVAASSAAKDKNNDGLYHADDTGRYDPVKHNGGKYYPDNSGRYIPDYSGLYNPDGTGLYAGDDSGKYKPPSGPYRPSSGLYRAKLFGGGQYRIPKTESRKEATETSKVSLGGYSHENKRAIYGNAASASTNAGTYKVAKPNPVRYNDGHWKIIRQAGGVEQEGYNYLYETENKILAEETAKVTNKGTNDESIESKGYYQYTGPDEVQYKLSYTADENGFIPRGDHLPAAIIKSLEYQRSQGKL